MTRLVSLVEKPIFPPRLHIPLAVLLLGIFLLYQSPASANPYSNPASANHFELYRLATQLELASSQLSRELRHIYGYSSVRSQANSLARDASRLVDAIDQDRSASVVRSRFDALSRRYNRLEDAFLRINRNRHNAYVFDEVGHIHNLFSSLSSEYYYASNRPQPRRPYYYAQPPVVSYQPNGGSRHQYSGRSIAGSRSHNQRQSSASVFSRQEVLVTGRSTQRPNTLGQGYDGERRGQQDAGQRRSRLDYAPVQLRQSNNSDHRSSVLDRQASAERQRRAVEAQMSSRHGSVKEVRRRDRRE